MEGIKQRDLKKTKIYMQVLRREVERTMNKQREKRRGQRKKLVAICAALLLCIFVMFLLFPCSNFSFFVMIPIVMDQSSNPATSSFWVSPSIFLLCKVVIADSIQVFELFLFALDLFPHFLSLSNFSILTLHFLPS
uniref:Putative ovule protein n=1 Tax=Solanum chacoense TaxID=4108 RepID=A0A0V0HB46_SOLCH